MRSYGVATRGIVLGDRGDVCDARAFSDLLRCPKSPSQCLIVRCRPSDGRASPSVVEGSGNRKKRDQNQASAVKQGDSATVEPSFT